MPAGSKPGERRGGRRKGGKNIRTLERQIFKDAITKELSADDRRRGDSLRRIEQQAEHAAAAVAAMRAEGRPLAKDALDMFLGLFMGRAAYYQPRPDKETLAETNGHANEDQFEKWAKHAVDVAKALAPFQSPTYRAIMIAQPPQEAAVRKKRFTLTIVDHHNGRVMPAEASVDDLD